MKLIDVDILGLRKAQEIAGLGKNKRVNKAIKRFLDGDQFTKKQLRKLTKLRDGFDNDYLNQNNDGEPIVSDYKLLVAQAKFLLSAALCELAEPDEKDPIRPLYELANIDEVYPPVLSKAIIDSYFLQENV